MTLGGSVESKGRIPLFPPSLEIAPDPHSHRHDYGFILVQAITTPLNCHPCCRVKCYHVPGRTYIGSQRL